ncbi:acyltransferase family protein [Pseudooceanicola sp. 200-1SW]|uniref:acyltransferase family protein n=1 Tax=Pseudooceanicola sp. 200-1SW TaxID=3425949 RepID=UPI003D7F4C4D
MVRCLMAWWVVVAHMLQMVGGVFWLPEPLFDALNRPGRAVNVFIVLSGFVITHLRLANPEPYPAYILRRGFRVYPIYLVCLALALAVSPLLPAAQVTPWSDGAGDLARWQEQWDNFGAHMLLHLTLLHGTVPETVLPYASGTFLAPAWSLSLEWQFYLLAPVLIGGLLMRGARGWIGWLALAALMALNLQARQAWGAEYGHPSALPLALNFFLLGILSRELLQDIAEGRLPLRPLVGLGVLIFGGLVPKLEVLIWALCGLAILGDVGLGGRLGAGYRALRGRADWMVGLGKISYSTYLVHSPVLILMVGATRLWISPSMMAAAFAGVLALPIVLWLSKLCYRHIETPGIALGRAAAARLLPPRGTPGEGG